MSSMMHNTLVWLHVNIEPSLEGTLIHDAMVQPLKSYYVALRRQH